MQRFRKQSASAVRAAERREREDGAERLAAAVPGLVSLKLGIEERSESSAVSQPKYIRRVVVASAPALFLIPCGDTSCQDGGHDVTNAIMHALHAHRTEFEGSDPCHGSLGSATCARILHFEGTAEYAKT